MFKTYKALALYVSQPEEKLDGQHIIRGIGS